MRVDTFLFFRFSLMLSSGVCYTPPLLFQSPLESPLSMDEPRLFLYGEEPLYTIRVPVKSMTSFLSDFLEP